MYIVFAQELDTSPTKTDENTVSTLDQAFARICCHCGLSYRFVPEEEGWRLELVDVERPECSPAPIRTAYKRPQDAQRHVPIANAEISDYQILQEKEGVTVPHG